MLILVIPPSPPSTIMQQQLQHLLQLKSLVLDHIQVILKVKKHIPLAQSNWINQTQKNQNRIINKSSLHRRLLEKWKTVKRSMLTMDAQASNPKNASIWFASLIVPNSWSMYADIYNFLALPRNAAMNHHYIVLESKQQIVKIGHILISLTEWPYVLMW